MKKILSISLIALMLAAGVASAESPCKHGKGKHMERMTEKLELTADQETQFREIMQAKREKMKSYHEEQRAETLSQLSTVLTDEQLAEFEEMSQRRHERKHKSKSTEDNS